VSGQLSEKGVVERVDTYTSFRLFAAGQTTWVAQRFFGGHVPAAGEINELPNGFLPFNAEGKLISVTASLIRVGQVLVNTSDDLIRALSQFANLTTVRCSVNGQEFQRGPLKVFAGPDIVVQGAADAIGAAGAQHVSLGSYSTPFLEQQIGQRQEFSIQLDTAVALSSGAAWAGAGDFGVAFHATFRTISPFFAR